MLHISDSWFISPDIDCNQDEHWVKLKSDSLWANLVKFDSLLMGMTKYSHKNFICNIRVTLTCPRENRSFQCQNTECK